MDVALKRRCVSSMTMSATFIVAPAAIVSERASIMGYETYCERLGHTVGSEAFDACVKENVTSPRWPRLRRLMIPDWVVRRTEEMQ